MTKSTQKIKIGSSGGIATPAKELKRQNIAFGDEAEVTGRPLHNANAEDQKVSDAAKKILKDYKQDFDNLFQR